MFAVMDDMALFGVPEVPGAGRLIAAVDAWASSVDGVSAAALEQVRLLAAMLDGQAAAIAAVRGRAAASQVAAAMKVSRELREALRVVEKDAARSAADAVRGDDPIARLLGELSGPIA